MKLIADGKTNAKTLKSIEADLGYYPFIMYLAPEKTSGLGNVCPFASPGCVSSCLFTAGRGATSPVQNAREKKTRMFYEERKTFLDYLHEDLLFIIRKCEKLKLKPCVRLNGTSDISWENYIQLENYPQIQFYDYTKNTQRFVHYMGGFLPANLHLTYSRSENNEAAALEIKREDFNVAVVFKPAIPNRWKRFSLFNGDKHDLRFLDPKKGFCGLTAKGKAKKDTTGFVVSL